MMVETHQAISIMYVMPSCHLDHVSCHHVISNMAPSPSSSAWAPSSNRSSIMTPRHHQVISSKAPPSPSSKDQAVIKYINWTMGSTTKCNGSKPSAGATSSTIKAWDHQLSKAPWTSSTSIDLAASSCDHCKGHHQVSRLLITVVVIKDNHQAGWHQWQSTTTISPFFIDDNNSCSP